MAQAENALADDDIEAVCLPLFPGGPCSRTSPLFHYSNTVSSALLSLVGQDATPLATLSPEGVLGAPPSGVLGLPQRDDTNSLTQVQALQAMYLLNGSLETSGFQKRMVRSLLRLSTSQTSLDAFSTFVLEHEISKSGIPDPTLLVVAAILIGLLIALSIGERQFDPLQSRMIVGLSGMLIFPLAIAFAGGVFLAVGYKFSMISALAAFLLLAIGVDDLFVLVASFDQVQAKWETDMHGCACMP